MSDLSNKLNRRSDKKSKRRDEKKRAIAQSTITALHKLGYANTSLRDIASVSDLSLGMLHYYFEDKTQLITYCVEDYKRGFVDSLLTLVETTDDPTQLTSKFAAKLARTVSEDAAMHTLWYDIRNQALFDASFKPLVDRIDNDLEQVVRSLFIKLELSNGENALVMYSALDGVFRRFLHLHLDGRTKPV
ncbi:MAG: TetR/AcrR family transcriptional regulator, partial [Pseudomonadota bacterium]